MSLPSVIQPASNSTAPVGGGAADIPFVKCYCNHRLARPQDTAVSSSAKHLPKVSPSLSAGVRAAPPRPPTDFTPQFPLSASSWLFMILILMDVFQCEVTQPGVSVDRPLPPTATIW
ncbi:unnamed protein product [Pleuronectes platessa]|uniref:Uncharacterized protein n=1 Tax=Pleuronectes platessa TaxID=8262 RepID=A0A9N7VPI2_PLEPL|nr:unnamed protein product [Pleuronectes platessa]